MKEFCYDVLISATDLEKPEVIDRHRAELDAGAKGHHSNATFRREEIAPYITRKMVDGQIVDQPETDLTRQYRVLRRFYR